MCTDISLETASQFCGFNDLESIVVIHPLFNVININM